MSKENFLSFLTAAGGDPTLLARYDNRNLAQLVFHAKNDGYDFSVEDVAAVVGPLEINVVLNKDGDRTVDGTAGLWRHMWGRRHLDYVVHHLVARHTAEELRALVENGVQV
jgi:hypothetical protein